MGYRTAKMEPLSNREGEFLGFYLHGNYCAEHEFGIGEINKAFNVSPTTYKINGNPPYERFIRFFGHKDYGLLYCDALGDVGHHVKSLEDCRPGRDWLVKVNKYLRDPILLSVLFRTTSLKRDIGCAWYDSGFIIVVHGKDNVGKLGALFDAFAINDVAIWMGGHDGNNPFARAGLCVGIYSRLDPDVIAMWESSGR